MDGKTTLVEFRWTGDADPLDFVGYALMTPQQVAEVERLLQRAERGDRIHPGWYIGPFAERPDDGGTLLRELTEALDLETLNGQSREH